MGFAQDNDPSARIRAAMAESLRKQVESVERQQHGIRLNFPTALPAWPATCEPVPAEQIGALVEEISRRQGLTPDLLRAVIHKESSYLPCAVSPKGAQGLMQLMPETASGLGVENPFEPWQNVDAGARYLRQMLDRYGGNLVLALAAYNAGPGRVDAAGGVPSIPETMNYVSEIIRQLHLASE
jgi:soluble lytic murein transglycosylase-like protein